jgi:phytoene dehydrogenase-like protein
MFQWLFKTLLGDGLVLPNGGMGRVSRQLAAGLPAASLRLRTRVEALQAEAGPRAGWRVRTTGGDIEATAVIVATEAPEAARLTGLPLAVPEGASCTTAYFAGPVSLYPDPVIVLNAAPDGFINGFVQVTNVAPSYAPSGQHLYAATILGVPELSDSEIADRCLAEIGAWFGPWVRDDLRLLQVFRIPFAQFRQPPGFFRALPGAETGRRGLFLAGEYCRYSNIEGAIASGEAAALRVMQTYLPGPPAPAAQ